MTDESKVKGFPDLSSKLSAPPKKSLFERQKAEAEAKRERERAETAAVYEDFVKSFDDDGGSDKFNRISTGGRFNSLGSSHPASGGLGGGAPKRHFKGSNFRNSGPGSLGPPPPLGRKRTHDGLYRDRDSSASGILAFENSGNQASDEEADRVLEDKDAERAAAKPTVYVSSLPPGTSLTVIKSLIPSNLTIDNIKILPSKTQTSTERRSSSAIVTFSKETAASDIDSAVSSLQNKYLGWGYNLSISRHLSSAAINTIIPVNSSSSISLPFGAKTVQHGYQDRLNRAPPPGPHRGGFAPPAPYSSQYGRPGTSTQIEVKPPSDIKQLKLIHMTLETLLTYGPEFEALLMSRPEVQKSEKWAWLWNPRSPGGVWYRWKLWEVLTNPKTLRTRRSRQESISSFLFEGGPNWVPPEKNIRFEFTTQIDEFVSDEDYNSSDEDDSDIDEERRRHANEDMGVTEDGVGYMNPLQKAKLTHLLARLPTTNAKLRRGDIARITSFAIEHAGEGADEVVQMLVSNVMTPLAFTRANPDRDEEIDAAKNGDMSRIEGNDGSDTAGIQTDPPGPLSKEKVDTSSAKLVGLYVISDILSSSSTSGVRHAWRYRQLFEYAFKSSEMFEHLGRLEKDLGWGRLKAEKWKRSIGTLLHLWEGWCVFPQSSHDNFVQMFEKPPLTKEEESEEKRKEETESGSGVFGAKGKSRWKTVDDDPSSGRFDPSQPPQFTADKMDIEYDGAPMANENEDTDGDPMSDIDGAPMEDSDLEDLSREAIDEQSKTATSDTEMNHPMQDLRPRDEESSLKREPPARRRRPRAEDMFADSDSDGE